MPLEFESLSHGKMAFGFFNIETDMILLNEYFLSAQLYHGRKCCLLTSFHRKIP